MPSLRAKRRNPCYLTGHPGLLRFARNCVLAVWYEGAGGTLPEFKTHSGLIGAFGLQVVLGLKMNPNLGRSINEVERLRQVGDYTGDSPSLDDTKEAVALAETFVAAIQAKFGMAQPRKSEP